jgi:hypothetical protein
LSSVSWPGSRIFLKLLSDGKSILASFDPSVLILEALTVHEYRFVGETEFDPGVSDSDALEVVYWD